MDRRAIEESAYRWVESAPCEDCDRFRECDKNEFECDELKKWRVAYRDAINKFENQYENKAEKNKQ